MKKLIYKVEDIQEDISFKQSFKSFFSGIFSYGGRENRRSYLYHLISYFVSAFCAGFIVGFILELFKTLKPMEDMLITVLSIPLAIMLFAAFFRRLRDIGFTTLGDIILFILFMVIIGCSPNIIDDCIAVLMLILPAFFKSNVFTINPKSFWTFLLRGKELKIKPQNVIDKEEITLNNDNDEI